jgi:DNA-binding transcriptional MocR family regulator
MDEQILGTLGELERKLAELERTLASIDRGALAAGAEASVAAPAAVASAVAPPPAGPTYAAPADPPSAPAPSVAEPYAARESRLVDELVPEAAAAAPPHAAPAPPFAPSAGAAQAPAAARTVAASMAGTEPAELLRFRDRLERTARELTNDYNELLGRLSQPSAPAAPPAPTISFARGAPSLDIIDVDGLRDAAVRALETDPGGATAYGTSVGYPRLRSWIADRHGVEPERVLVTNGSMQADAFLFAHLVHAGEDVIVERPTYDRTLLSLRERGANVHAITLGEDGIDTSALARELRAGRVLPRLAHIIPNFQNPAGYTLSLAKREELLALAAEYEFVVFEDDPYVALRFRGESLPTMLSMDPDRVVYASSFSKTVCPGVRVGYLVGPAALIEAVSNLARDTYISPSMISQAIVYEFCASGAIERSIQTVRRALEERAETLTYALRRELPEARFTPPDGGYFMWLTLPHGTDVVALEHAAAELGVSFVKGTDFVLEGGENALRLAFAGVTPKQIDDGVTRLAAAYRSVTARR